MVNKEKEFDKIPLIYIYIYKKIYENTIRLNIISYRVIVSEFKQILHRIPKKYYNILIKELIDFNLMEKVSGGRSPTYKINHEDYKNKTNELNKLEKSGLRFEILKDKYENILKKIEQVDDLDQKYNLLRCDYKKLLRKLELKKIEGYHYW